jgi:phage gpG-like protein
VPVPLPPRHNAERTSYLRDMVAASCQHVAGVSTVVVVMHHHMEREAEVNLQIGQAPLQMSHGMPTGMTWHIVQTMTGRWLAISVNNGDLAK